MKIGMGIIKVEISIPELVRAVEDFRINKQKVFEQIATEVKRTFTQTFNQLLQTEMDLFLGQAEQAKNKRNGYYEREFAVKGLGCLRLRFPRDRNRKFESSIFPKNEQIDSRLKQDLAVLHLAGISNRVLSLVSHRVLGIKVSAQTVHNSLGLLEEKALAWLERDLTEKYWALFIDGTNFKIQRRGSTEKEPTLVVLGIDSRNAMSILTLQPGQKDSAECWGAVFSDLVKRGLDPSKVQIGIMDGLPGLENKFKEYFNKATTARCWVHAKRNALLKCSGRLKVPFEELLAGVMYAASESQAREAFRNLKYKMGPDGGRAVSCIEKDLDSLLVHYRFEKRFWRTLKTTNPIERVNKELKRRTKTMEGLGEKTLNVLLAFTAMRLEYYWKKIPVDSKQINNLKNMVPKNIVEDTLEQLIH